VGAGSTVDVNLLALMGTRGRIYGSTLRARPLEQKADAAQLVAHHVLPLLEAGELQIPVEASVAMAEATTAYERFESGGKLGKIVLVNDAAR
jgi:NADPH:quinone reductase-like Zn-dependent oxidoreductase